MELIPVISFLTLKGRCKHCQKPIARRHLSSEVLLAGLLVAAYWLEPQVLSLAVWVKLAVVLILFVPFLFDFHYGLLPDVVTHPAIVLVLMYLTLTSSNYGSLLIGALIGGGVFLLQYVVSRGRWVGAGDWRLGILVGLLLGWPHVLTMLFMAYVGGAIIAIVLLLLGSKKIKDRVPMGAFLIPATLVVLWYGESLIKWLPI
jgi:prepilin signal peptidase PulO-like enzyme (type II secretory pathway)